MKSQINHYWLLRFEKCQKSKLNFFKCDCMDLAKTINDKLNLSDLSTEI